MSTKALKTYMPQYSLKLKSASSQYASISDGAQTGLDITGNITIGAWVKIDTQPSASAMTIAGKWGTAGARSYLLRYEDVAGTKKVIFYRSNGGTSVTDQLEVSISLSIGTWNHVFVTFNTSTGAGIIYVNGKPHTFSGTASSTFNSGEAFTIGANASANYLNGSIAFVRIFNDVRTASEIVSDAHTEAISDANLVGEWSFQNVLTDASGNSNTLTASGSPVYGVDVPFQDTFGIESDQESLRLIAASTQSASITDASQTSLDITGDMSVEVWVCLNKLPSVVGSNATIIKKDDVTNRSYNFGILTADDKMFFSYYESIKHNRWKMDSAFTIDDIGKWVHLAVTVDVSAETILFYKNGILQAGSHTIDNNGTSIDDTAAAVEIGNDLDALMQTLRVFNDIRTQAEIVEGATAYSIADANIVAEWKFDGDYQDLVNSNTLTPVNSPTFESWSNFIAGGLVSYWTLDESTGTREDSHGVNDLTDNNTVLSNTGKQSDAADFERDNSESLSITDASQVGLDITKDISISVWAKFESVSDGSPGSSRVLMSKWSEAGNNRSFIFELALDNNIRFQLSPDGSTSESLILTPLSAITTATWYHIVVAWDASAATAFFYINGIYQGKITGAQTGIFSSAGIFQIGAYHEDILRTMDGLIDEAAIWNRVLGYGEVLDLYSEGDGISYIGVTPVSVTIGEMAIGALDLDRVNSEYSYIENVYCPNLRITGDITIESWVKLASLPADGEFYPLIVKADFDGDGVSYALLIGGIDTPPPNVTAVLNFILSDDGSTTYSRYAFLDISVGEWMHIAATYNQSLGQMKLYVNGIEVFSGGDTPPAAIYNSAADVYVGGLPSFGEYFDGEIKDLRVWNTVRTAAQMVSSYNTRVDAGSTNLQAFWEFVSAWNDSTSNLYHLTNAGGSTVSDSPYANFGITVSLPFMNVVLPLPVTVLPNIIKRKIDQPQPAIFTGTYILPEPIDLSIQSAGLIDILTSFTTYPDVILGQFVVNVTSITADRNITLSMAAQSIVALAPSLAKVGSVWFRVPRSTDATWTPSARKNN